MPWLDLLLHLSFPDPFVTRVTTVFQMTYFIGYLIMFILNYQHFLFVFQYSAVDTSPLSIYVMHPFWNYVVEVSSMLFAL